MRKLLLQLATSLCIGVGAWMGYLHLDNIYLPFEQRIKDLMFKTRGPIIGDESIIIVDIDEKSLKELGQWPWSRDVVATLLQNLAEYGVGIVGMDVVFAEPDNSSPKRVFEKLGLPSENVVDYDVLFAQTIAQTPTIVGYVFALTNDGIDANKYPKSKAIIIEKNKPVSSFLIKPYRVILNIPQIEENAYSSAYFNTVPDSDGIVRSIPMVMEYHGVIYPSLSLEMMRIVLNQKKIEVLYDDAGISHLQLGDIRIPTDFYGRMLINFRGPEKSYRYISASDVYFKRANALHVKGKIALLGTSAAGLLDLRSTPFESVYAGVEVHANALDNILNQSFLSKPIWIMGIDQLSIFSVSFVTFAILLISSAVLGFVSLLVLNAVLIGVHYYFMIYEGLLLNTIIPFVVINLFFIIGQAINYFLEIRQKEMIKGKFASKVSPAVMNDILSSAEDVLEGKEREITVFFSDIRNFTSISEAMGNAKNLIHLMNSYMNPMTEIIIKTGGTVDKFIGDSIMAYWNAPTDVPNHADQAVIASLKQLHRLKELNASIKTNPEFANVVTMSSKKGIPIIDIGIGLNTGIAIVGEMGSSGRSDYTVIGDPINLGSRLESLCKYYDSKLNISNFTKEKLTGPFIYRFLDLVTVKGKSEPIEIWQIHDFDEERESYLFSVSREQITHELKAYHEAIAFYKEASFSQALSLFQKIERWENKTNHAVYPMYIERCIHYIEVPPSNFNGVFVHTSKG
jgi:adenylate cyclase